MSNGNCLKIYIAGHNGMVGSALATFTKKKVEIITKNRTELDLLNQKEVGEFFEIKKLTKYI